MKVADTFEEAVIAVTANKVRSGLTMLGIIIGIASVIALTAIGQGSQASITSRIEAAGSNLLTVIPGFSSGSGLARGQFGGGQTLSPGDATAITQLSNVQAEAPALTGRYQAVGASGNANESVVSTTPAYQSIRNVTLTEGTFFTDGQNSSADKVAVLGSAAATDLFGDTASGGTDPLGQTFRLKNLTFTVIGVATAQGGFGPQSADNEIYVPLTTGQRLLAGQAKYVNTIYVQAATQSSMTQLQSDITDLLLQRHNITDSSKADFRVMNQSTLASTATSTARTLTILLAVVAGISLLVGGIGIMNMMLTTVTERTREIGLRKAIGAQRRDISFQFLVEAVLLTFGGGIVGVILGWGVAWGVKHFTTTTTVVTTQWVILAFGLSAFIGIIFGLYPARRASALNPIQALRYE
jgi:putative ABC transport system permease protein